MRSAAPGTTSNRGALPYIVGSIAVFAIGIGIGLVVGADDAAPGQTAAEPAGADTGRHEEPPGDGADRAGAGSQGGDDAGAAARSALIDDGPWEVVTDQEAWAEGRESQGVRDLVQHDGDVIALGGGMGDAVVYSSPDGLEWSRYPDDDRVLEAFTSEVYAAAAGDDGIVAVGQHRGLEHSHRTAGVWFSEDGSSWERIEDDLVFDTGQRAGMDGVAATLHGMVAVGHDGHPFREEPVEAAVWRSSDGRNWERMRDDASDLGGMGVQRMYDVVEGGPGLIAVGVDDRPGADRRAAVWTSTDGSRWDRVDPDNPAFDGPGSAEMLAITAFDDGYVTVGQGGDASAGVWTSPDGERWERVPEDPDNLESGSGGTPLMVDVTPVGDLLLAVGYERSPEGGSVGVACWSEDGTAWHRLDDQGAFEVGSVTSLHAVVVLEDRVLVGGRTSGGEGVVDPIMWVLR